MKGHFVTGTGTGVGKTWVTRGLARALLRGGHAPRAIKPLETGVELEALDAHAIARAAGHEPIERGTYRASPGLAPWAITLQGDHDAPIMESIVEMITSEATDGWLLVEGAGGLLVPLSATQTMATLAQALELPLLLIAQDVLGTLSHTLTAVESAQRRALTVSAVILTGGANREQPGDNQDVLRRLLGTTPVLRFRTTEDDDDALAREAVRSGVLDLVVGEPSGS